MKKISYLVALLIVMLIPTVVKADMSSPVFGYKVVVTNKDGAQDYEFIYNDKGKINKVKKNDGKFAPYDTLLVVEYETNVNKENYLTVYTEDKDNTYYIINEKDVDLIGKINPKDYEVSYVEEFKVFKEGAYLYKGPSKIFGKVDDDYMLPIGATFKAKYSTDLFAYVEYEGHKGWVFTYPYEQESPYSGYASVANTITENIKSFYTLGKQEVYKEIDRTNSEKIVVPDNTQIIPKLSYSYAPHYNAYLFEYKGDDYWIFDGDDVTKIKNINNDYLITFTDVKVYSDHGTFDNDFTPKKATGKTVPKYTKITYDYYYCTEYGEYCSYYIDNKSYTGWVYSDSDKNIIADSMYPSEFKLDNDVVSYKTVDAKSDSDKITIPKGTKIDAIEYSYYDSKIKETVYLDYMYVTNSKYMGFVKTSDIFNNTKTPTVVEPSEQKELDPRSETYPSKESKNIKTKKKTVTEKKDSIILYAVIISGFIVLSGIVLIIYTFKKTRSNKSKTDVIATNTNNVDKEIENKEKIDE